MYVEAFNPLTSYHASEVNIPVGDGDRRRAIDLNKIVQ